jgi:hypothetical protein
MEIVYHMDMRFCALALAGVLFAQDIADEKEYEERMRAIDHSFTVLEENRRVRRNAGVEEEAERLARLFAEVEAFWEGRGRDDLAGYARMAKEGAERAAEAARNNDEKSLQAAIDTMARSCEGCHREPLDKYRIPRS